MSAVKLRKIHFKGYEAISDQAPLAAAVVVPAGCRLLATSGHVGVDLDGKLAEDLKDQIEIAFRNAGRSIIAALPTLTEAEAWSSVYQITTFHMGGLGENVTTTMFETAERLFQGHRPAWTAVGVEELAFGRFEIAVLAALPPE